MNFKQNSLLLLISNVPFRHRLHLNIPDILKTNEILGGGAQGAPPPYENNEGVLLGPYSQKGPIVELIAKNWDKISEIARDFEKLVRNWPILKIACKSPILEILGSTFLKTSSF